MESYIENKNEMNIFILLLSLILEEISIYPFSLSKKQIKKYFKKYFNQLKSSELIELFVNYLEIIRVNLKRYF